MNKDPSPTSKLDSSSQDQNFEQSKRRRLIKSGLGASALITTVASRSAWAGDKCTRSGLDSANLSGQHTFPGCGKSAGYWKTHNWPVDVQKTTLFTNVFGSYAYKGSTLFAGKTLFQVISDTGSSNSNPANIGLHLIGAYVNAFAFPKSSPSGKGFVYSPEEIVSMFQNTASGLNADFTSLKNTLELANNQYDAVTNDYWN